MTSARQLVRLLSADRPLPTTELQPTHLVNRDHGTCICGHPCGTATNPGFLIFLPELPSELASLTVGAGYAPAVRRRRK